MAHFEHGENEIYALEIIYVFRVEIYAPEFAANRISVKISLFIDLLFDIRTAMANSFRKFFVFNRFVHDLNTCLTLV
jgi:hypothetical protein